MNPKWKRIADQAKRVVDQRGGTESLKRDADELKTIAKGKGSLSDKAKAAAQALKEPGATGATGSTKGTDPVVDQQAGAVEASESRRKT
ncbi:hypothetical protein HJD18_10510 [Thermoleophilia bacterium SCSIO 60948]|nr:hypothetical protein HJD18_10510 [Thermoleophilia bacterium SCSIO 60948]